MKMVVQSVKLKIDQLLSHHFYNLRFDLFISYLYFLKENANKYIRGIG